MKEEENEIGGRGRWKKKEGEKGKDGKKSHL
jgi:hypothetical protein